MQNVLSLALRFRNIFCPWIVTYRIRLIPGLKVQKYFLSLDSNVQNSLIPGLKAQKYFLSLDSNVQNTSDPWP